ncbi:MAG: FtsX-like permease family protein, partial [Coriobacteriia bacterium]|nr:FtsX-like permease family protein [Coriobacteriia bacterium]
FGNEDISVPVVIQGRDIDSELRGIWINLEYAQEHDVSVGDSIEVVFHENSKTLEVLGIIMSPTRMHFTGTSDFMAQEPSLFGHGQVSDAILREYIVPHSLPNFVEVVHDGALLRELVPEMLGAQYLSYFDRASFSDVSYPLERAEQIQGLSLLFSSMFILLSVLAMHTSIRRLIEVQTKDIATLKALGYSNGVIGFHYASFGLLVGGAGSLVGLLCAPLVSNFVMSSQQHVYTLPEWTISYSWASLAVAALVISICTAAAFGASKKARKGLPAVYLRGNTIRAGKATPLEKNASLWTKIGFGSRWALRDGFSNPVRVLMGVIGVAGSMMLLIAGFGGPNTVDRIQYQSFEVDFNHVARVRIHALNSDAENADLQRELNGQWMQTLMSKTTPTDGFDRVLTIFGEGDHIQLQTIDGNYMQREGAYISEGFAQSVDLDVGDFVQVQASMDTESREFEVAGIVEVSAPQGVYVSSYAWQAAGGNFQPQELLVGNFAAASQVRNDLRVEQVTLVEDQRENMAEFTDRLRSVYNLIIVLAVFLAVVVLYNLGALNFTERQRDYATLRVLGFHRSEIRALAMKENILTTVVGWLLGIPLGFWFLAQYMEIFSNHRVVYYPHLEAASFIIASCIVIGCSLTTTIFLGRRIKKIDMVETIKGVE